MHLPSPTITLEAALRDVAASRDARQRCAAAHALGDVTAPDDRRRAVEVLIAALDDAHPDVRAAAALSLGDLGDHEAVEPLIAALDNGVPLARQAAAMALGKLGAARAFEALAAQLREGPPDMRFQAATSLVEIDAERSYDLLVAALDDADAEVAGAAALGLGAVGDPRAVGHLAGRLDHPAPKTRFEIAYALAQLGSDRGWRQLVDGLSDDELGWSAIEMLERLNARAALDALLDFALGRKGTRVNRVRAAAAVLALAPDHPRAGDAHGALHKALRSFKLEVRALAVQELGRVGGEAAAGPLQALRAGYFGRGLRDEIDAALARVVTKAPCS